MASPQTPGSQASGTTRRKVTSFKACPNCGAAEITERECPSCGIVFTKWLAREAARQQGVERAPQSTRVEEQSDVVHTGLDVQISPATRIMRVAMGLFACLLAFFLYSSGKAMLDFQLFVVLLTYACVGVWVFATTLAPISTRQFMVEVLFIAVATVPAYALNPEIFGFNEPGLQKHDLRFAPRQDMSALVNNTLLNLRDDLESNRVFTRDERNAWISSVHQMPLASKLKGLADKGQANEGDVYLINDLSASLERALVRSWVQRNGDWKLVLSEQDRASIAQKFSAIASAFGIETRMPDKTNPASGTPPPAPSGAGP